MIQVAKLYLNVDISKFKTLRDIALHVSAEVISPENVRVDDLKTAYVFTTNPLDLAQAIIAVSQVLAVRQLHSSMETFNLTSSSIFRYDSSWTKPLISSSLEILKGLLTPTLPLPIKPKSTFLDLELTEANIRFYCEAHSNDPIWSLFFPQLVSFKRAIADLPKDKSWYKNNNLHPVIERVLNSVVRSVPDYLCFVTSSNGQRVETLERIPIFGYLSADIPLLCKIILNDYGLSQHNEHEDS